MRRVLATAALGLALFAVTACADPPQPERNSDGKVDLVDKSATCDAYEALQADIEKRAAPIEAKIEQAKNDPLQAASAYGEFLALLNEYEAKTTEIEAKAADAEVKSALGEELTVTRKAQADLKAAGSDPAKIQAVLEEVDEKPRDRIAALCK